MKMMRKVIIFLAMIPLIAILSSCNKSAENEHLPEYCRTYSDFIEFASRDMYELVDGINRHDYLNAISAIELDFEVNDPSREIDLDGIQCFQNLTSLSLTGISFKDISEVSALKNIQEITLVETSVVSIDSFKNLSKVKSLTITNTKTLQSVTGVEEMTKLRNLELVGNGIVNIESLSKLTNLVSLNLSDNEMVFFPSITGLDNLTSLNLANNNIVNLGEDLSGLSHLIILDLNNNEICDLSNFDDLSDLEFLDLSDNDLGCLGTSPDFTSLSAATGLTELYLNGNDLDDISGLADVNIPNLEYLYLHDNDLTDISYISSYNNLVELTLHDNNLTSIDNISGMTQLTEIDLSDNNIESFGGLTNISGLEIIDLQNNNISVIPELRYDLPNLRFLDLSYNNLTDTSGIEGHQSLEELYLDNNGLETLTGLKDIPFLTTLSLFNDEVICEDEIVEGELCENPKYSLNTNEISNFVNSFVNLPSYTGLVGDFNEFNYDAFEFGNDVTITGSFINIPFIDEIDFSDQDINSIDADSFVFPQLTSLFLQNNNFTDISFLLGNPSLTEVILSNNQISNLDVINGTNTSDFDNLQAVYANNIFTANDLDGAFVSLPELSILELGNTSLTGINNSLNDLPQLTELIINSGSVTEINNSFNNLFTLTAGLPGTENGINFSNGNVTSIISSFNGSNFEYIDISGQTPLGFETEITDSFNDIELSSSSHGLNLSSSHYKIISGSFNDVVAENISIANSNVDSITTSFSNVVLQDYLRLYINNLTTLPDLATVEVPTLALQSNQLTTVSFIHDIVGLTTLNLDTQEDELGNATLLTIDGINNQPLLEILTLVDLEITSIDGLRNVGLTTFEYQADQHNDVQIETISATSFENNVIIQLNLGGNEFDDVTFLDNFDLLTELAISFTHTDIAFLTGQEFESSLTSLLIATNSVVTDFAPLQAYDSIDTLVLITPFTNVYNNIDDMDSLTNLNIYFPAAVTEFNGSFNTMPVWSIDGTYVQNTYSNLFTITNSFHMLTTNELELPGHITVVDSFDNVTGLTVTSSGELASLIDGDSFDRLTTLTLDDVAYLSYASFADFEALETVTIENLGGDILDFTSTSVLSLTVNAPDFAADIYNIDLPETADLFITDPATDIAVGVTFPGVNITSAHDVAIGSTADGLGITGTMDNLLIQSTDLTTVSFSNLEVNEDIVMDTENVDLITTTITQTNNANQLTVNSNVPSFSYEATVLTMNINNNTATQMTATAIDNINVVSDEAVLDLDLAATTVNVLGTDLTDLTGTFSGDDLVVSSPLLTSLDLEASTTLDVDVTTVAPSFTLSGTGNPAVTLNNDNISSLILSANAMTLDMTTLSIADMTISGDIDEISFTGNNALSLDVLTANIADMTVVGNTLSDVLIDDSTIGTIDISGAVMTDLVIDASSVTTLNSLASAFLDTITYVDSSVVTGSYFSNQAAITVSRTHPLLTGNENTPNTINLDALNASSVVIDADNTDVAMDSDQAIMNVTAVADVFDLTNASLSTITFDNSSAVGNIRLLNNDALQSVDLGTATTNNLDISSAELVVTVSAINSLDTVIDGDNFTDVNTNVGSNILTVNSQKVTSMTFDVSASTFTANTNLTTINFDDTSAITTFTSDSSNLTTVNAGTGAISTSNILSSATLLSINGTNLDAINVTSNDFDTFNAVIDPLASIGLTSSTSNSGVEVTTNTTAIYIDMNNAGVTLYGAVLDTIDVTADDFTFAGTKAGLTLDLTLDATTALFNTANIDHLTIADTSSIGTLTLNGTNMSGITLGSAIINTLDVTSAETAWSLDGTINTALFDAPNMNSLSVANNASGAVDVTTSAASFDVNGVFNTFAITDQSVTSIDISGATLNTLEVTSDSLAALNTFTNVTDSFVLDTDVNNFNLTSEVDNVTVTSVVTNNFILNSNKSDTMNITSNVQSMNITAPLASFVLDAANVNSLVGTVNEMTVNNNALAGALTVDMDAATFTYGTSSVATGINLTGARTINDFVVFGAAQTVTTGNVVDTSILLAGSGQNYDLDTLLNDVELSNAGTVTIEFNDQANVNVDGSATSVDITGVTNTVTVDVIGDVAIDYGAAATVTVTGSATTLDITGVTNTVALTMLGDVVIDYGASADVTITGSATSVSVLGITNLVTLSLTGDVTLDYGANSSATLAGTANALTIVGTSINTIDTSSLTTLDSLVVDNTLMTNLDFVDSGLYSTLTSISMNTLDTATIGDVITYLDGTGITLTSPLTDQDVYDYFYNPEYAALEAQEAIDNLIYDSVRSTEVNEALAVFRLNTNFDFLLDADLLTDINEHIDTNGVTTYNIDEYMNLYAVDQGYTDEADMRTQLGDGAVDPIETSMLSTLADTELNITETALQEAVVASLEIDANAHATTESANKGWTIG